MTTLATGTERRRAPRAPVHGRAVIHGDGGATQGNLENLSLGGALVRTGPMRGRRDVLDVELMLPIAGRVMVSGRLVRVDRHADGARVALRFRRMSANAEDAIADEVATAFVALQKRTVLVIETEPRRTPLMAALRARKMNPLAPATPLELVDLLSSPSQHVEVCVLGESVHAHQRAELAATIAETFPWVRIKHATGAPDAVADDASAEWDAIDARAWG